MSDYAYKMGENLKHIHISDNDRLPPGSGVGDFPSLIDALIDIEFDGFLTMETGFHRRGIEPDEDARTGHRVPASARRAEAGSRREPQRCSASATRQ